MKEFAVPTQETCCQYCGSHGDVFEPEHNGLFDRSRRTPDPQSAVPQPILKPLRDVFDERRQMIAVENQEIDIRMNRHFSACITTYGNDGEMIPFHDAVTLEVDLLGETEEAPNHAIDQIGVGLVDAAS